MQIFHLGEPTGYNDTLAADYLQQGNRIVLKSEEQPMHTYWGVSAPPFIRHKRGHQLIRIFITTASSTLIRFVAAANDSFEQPTNRASLLGVG